jgi:hypothetical protein
LRGAVQALGSAGHAREDAAATFQIDGTGHGNDVTDSRVLHLALVQQAQQPAHTPTHQGQLLAFGMRPYFFQGGAKHRVGVVLQVEMSVLLFWLTPIDKVGFETAGGHIAHQAALGHQVKGFGGHPQRRHQHQWHGVLAPLHRPETAVHQLDLLFLGQTVIAHRHQVTVVYQFKPGTSGLDECIALEQPVSRVGRPGGQPPVERKALPDSQLREIVHAASSAC